MDEKVQNAETEHVLFQSWNQGLKNMEADGCPVALTVMPHGLPMRTKYGYADAAGKLTIPCEYDFVAEYSEGLVRVKRDNQWGLFDKTGKMAVPFAYDLIGDVCEGAAIVKKGAHYGLLDADGKQILPCEYDNIEDFSEGLAAVERGAHYGYVDPTGKLVIPCEYQSARYAEGRFCLLKDGQMTIRNRDMEPTN